MDGPVSLTLGEAPAQPSPPFTHQPSSSSADAFPTSIPAVVTQAAKRKLGSIIRIAASIAACSVAGAFLYDRFFNLGSTRAVLSGAVLTLRAPTEGALEILAPIVPGDIVGGGTETFAVIRNPRVDTGRLADMHADLGSAQAELRAVGMRLEATRAEARAAVGTAESFRTARLEQLAARSDEVDGNLAAARARLREAESALRRASELMRTGAGAQMQLDQAQRGHAVAEGEVSSLQQRRLTLKAEMRAAQSGVFVSDVGTDRSASQQAADRFRFAAEDLGALEVERLARVASLKERIAAEEQRVAMLSAAPVPMPARARVLSLLAGPGENVRAGQDLASLADCSRPIANVEVDERTFRSLAIGMRGDFVTVGDQGRERYVGRIAQMASPLRVDPASPGADIARHRVTIALEPDLLKTSCSSGTVGRVEFHRGTSSP